MFEISLVVASLLCGMVAGFLFGFAVVAMPGIQTLGDREFIRAFQAMDRIIQNNHPLFLLVWIGSVIAVVAAAATGFPRLEGLQRAMLLTAAGVYLLGVQVPTASINIPLNNAVQKVDAGGAAEERLAAERRAFEPRWNRWNRVRTFFAVAATSLFLVLLLRVTP